MKATIKREEVFTLTVGEVTIPDLRVKSKWNGMSELVNGKGEVLIVSGLSSSNPFADVMDAVLGVRPDVEVRIVSGSPALLAMLAPKAEA